MPRKMLIAGNWKMNGLLTNQSELGLMIDRISAEQFERHDVLICPPATILASLYNQAKNSGLLLGGEDCHPESSGAHTGDISAEMLADVGASYCIVGHSERREGYHESNALIKSKAEAALRAGLIAIVCVGETLDQRESGEAISLVSLQVTNSLPSGADADNCVIAYEPIWAIGTGKTATLDDINEMHGAIRGVLKSCGGDDLAQARILYGGSVNPGNATEIFGLPDVDGGLVGGASLTADKFCPIVDAAG
ncbi:MAG: triose-phosphate isomerase [Robiginitomaculum sp.]|nr:MAG: triose-phosphate isomerase [Robiginitomaculum sp.]